MSGRRRKPQNPKYLTEQELQGLFGSIKSARDRCIFSLAYELGLRASEVGLLQVGDYSERTNRIEVRRLKGSISRGYALSGPVLAALRAWLRERGKVPGPLFPGYRGRGIGRRMLDTLMRGYAAVAGLPLDKRHFHCLKHSIATHLGSRGETVAIVQDHLGHADVRSTMVYLKVTEKAREELAARRSREGVRY